MLDPNECVKIFWMKKKKVKKPTHYNSIHSTPVGYSLSTCIINCWSFTREPFANWLRSSGIHDNNNGHNLSHLKSFPFNGNSPSSVSIDWFMLCASNDSIASLFVLIKLWDWVIDQQIVDFLLLFDYSISNLNLNGFTQPLTIGFIVAKATLSTCRCGGSRSNRNKALFLIRSRETAAAKWTWFDQMCWFISNGSFHVITFNRY